VPLSAVSPPPAASATDSATSTTNCRYDSSWSTAFDVGAVFALLGAASVSFSTASGEDLRPDPVSVDVCGLADWSAGVALLGRGDVLAGCVCLFEGVEEAAVAERRE
jgi:hypothetical protein